MNTKVKSGNINVHFSERSPELAEHHPILIKSESLVRIGKT